MEKEISLLGEREGGARKQLPIDLERHLLRSRVKSERGGVLLESVRLFQSCNLTFRHLDLS